MMKISVIIPVFNAEKYLSRCLDSVLASLGKIKGEILLIDNDSSDGSLGICEEYAKKHKKTISALQCHTPGAGAVRNFGVLKAKGEYVWFIDADDEIKKSAISELLTEAQRKDADMVMLGIKRVYQNGAANYLSAVDSSSPDYKSRFIRYGLGPVQVLFRRSWWLSRGFKFKEGVIQEDMELMSALILYTDKYAFIDKPLYIYYQNPDSVLHKKEFSPHIFDIFPALEGLYQRFVDAEAEKEYYSELEWFFIWNLLIDSAKDFGQFPEGKVGFARSREMLKRYFPGWRKNHFLRKKPLKLQIRVRLNYKK